MGAVGRPAGVVTAPRPRRCALRVRQASSLTRRSVGRDGRRGRGGSLGGGGGGASAAGSQTPPRCSASPSQGRLVGAPPSVPRIALSSSSPRQACSKHGWAGRSALVDSRVAARTHLPLPRCRTAGHVVAVRLHFPAACPLAGQRRWLLVPCPSHPLAADDLGSGGRPAATSLACDDV